MLESLEGRQMLSVQMTGSFLSGQKSGWTVSDSDLINGLTPTYPDSNFQYQATYEGGPIANLTNGTTGVGNDEGSNNTNCIFDADTAFLLEYQLPLAASPTGFTISEIDVYSGHGDNRSNIRADLLIELVSNPGVWTSLGAGTYALDQGNGAGKMQITDTTGTIATGVKGIRFKDLGAGDIYRELDVIGVPSGPPAAPSGLSGIPGNQSAVLSWTQVPGVTYTLKSSTSFSGPFTAIPAATNIVANTFTDTGLTNGTLYYYVLSATNSVSEGANSAPPVAVMAGLVAPAAPTNVNATGGFGQVSITWTAPAFADTYTVLRSDTLNGTYTALPAGTGIAGTSFNDTTGTIGSTYFYKVTATNGAGTSPQSAADSGQVGAIGTGSGLTGYYYNNRNFAGPAADTRLDAQVNFDWGGDPGGNPSPNVGINDFTVRWLGELEAPFTGQYRLGTDTDDGGRIVLNVGGTPTLVSSGWFDQGMGETEWSGVINLTAGQKYAIGVEMYEAGGGAGARLRWEMPDGTITAQAIPTSQLYPTAASMVPVQPGLGAAGATPSVTLNWSLTPLAENYSVLRSETIDGTYTTLASNITTTNFTDTTGVIGTRYFYKLLANNSVGSSERIVLVGNGTGLTGYYYNNRNFAGNPQIRLDANVDFDWGNSAPIGGLNADQTTTRWIGQLEAPHTGTYRLGTDTDDGGRIFLDGVQISSAGWVDQGPGSTEWSSEVFLTQGQKYTIVMDFYEAGGGEVARLRWEMTNGTITAQAIPGAQLYPATAVPTTAATNVVADAVANRPDRARITWTTDTTANAIAAYRIERGPAADGPWTTVASVYRPPAYAEEWIDTGLAPATQYFYRIVSFNGAGDGAISNLDPVTTTGLVIEGAGAAGHYYGALYTDTPIPFVPTYLRLDSTIDLLPGNGGGTPVPGVIGNDGFTVRWTGKLTAPTTGFYSFTARSDDGARLWVDGISIADAWINRGSTDSTGGIFLIGGQSYNFVYEFFENGGDAAAQFDWSRPGAARERVPASAMTAVSDVPVAPTGVTASVVGTNHVQLKWNDIATSEVEYRIERSTASDFSANLTTFSRPINTTVFNDYDLAAGTYYYRVVAANYDGTATSASVSATPVAAASGGTLNATYTSSDNAFVNLPFEGSADWAQYGRENGQGTNRKAGVPAKITPVDGIGGPSFWGYGAGAPFPGFTWTNGTPIASMGDNRSGLRNNNLNGSYRFTVPADTTTKTVKIYVSAYRAQGTLTATLSDGSASAFVSSYVDTQNLGQEHVYYVYTIDYQAASANQDLIIDWKKTADYGDGDHFVTLQAVALKESSSSTDIPANFSAGQVTDDVKLTWSFSNNATGYVVQTSLDGATWTDLATINNSSTTTVIDNNPTLGLHYYRVKATGPVADSDYTLPIRIGVVANTPVSYPNFNSITGLVLNGNANNTSVPGALTLTQPQGDQKSSVFTEIRQYVNRWNAQFDFQTRDTNPNDDNADGFTFTLQDNSPSAIGNGGGSMGYETIGRSVAVTFNYYNHRDDIGIVVNGASPSSSRIDIQPHYIELDKNGVTGVWRVELSYDGSTLIVGIYDPANPQVCYRMTQQIDIPYTIGNDVAYVGFTGATGGAFVGQDILNFSFTNTTQQTVDGTFDADNIVVKLVGADTKIWVNTNPTTDPATYSWPKDSLNQIKMLTSSGNDTITIDYSGGDPLPLHGIDLQTDYSGDTLQLLGGTGDDVFGAGYSLGSGYERVGSLLHWVNVDSVQTVSVNGSGGTDTIRVQGVEYGDSFSVNAADTFTWGSKTLTYAGVEKINVYGGGGDDTLTINATPNVSPVFYGGEKGVDTLTVNTGASYTFTANTSAYNNNLVVNQYAGTIVNVAAHTNIDEFHMLGAAQFKITAPQVYLAMDDGTALPPPDLGVIDVGSGAIIVKNGGDDGYTQFNQLIGAGRAFGGLIGVTSSGLSSNKDIYVIVNNNGSGQTVVSNLWGRTMGNNDNIIRMSYKGDANLSGKVDIDDYFLIDTNYALGVVPPATPSYYQGDFNDDGVIDASDYFIIDLGFISQGAPLAATAGPTAIPILPPAAGSPASPFSSAPFSERDWDNADVLA